MSWIEDPGVDVFLGLDLRELHVDEAYVRVRSEVAGPLWLYSLAEDCYRCSFSRLAEVTGGNSSQTVLRVSARDSYRWRLLRNGSSPTLHSQDYGSVLCEAEVDPGEFGVYELSVSAAPLGVDCRVRTLLQPVNVLYPLVICLAALLLLCCLPAAVGRCFRGRRKGAAVSPTGGDQEEREEEAAATKQAPRRRVQALDTFRGISIVIMIFVNYGAGGYWFFDHATWNGLRVADLVFPWFMWIMGVCIPISVTSQLRKGVPRCRMVAAVLRRSCILFLLGLILSTKGVGANLETIRVFGVLQRFSVTYLAVAALLVLLSRRRWEPPGTLRDVLVLAPHWALVVLMVAGYCALLFLLEVPGCPRGYLGPGGNHEDGRFRNCVGGATGYVDRLVLGKDHLYQRPTADEVYGSGAFDPEGLVGCIPSVFQVFLGVQAGTTLVTFPAWKPRVVRWLSWGALCGVSGAVLCLCSREGGWIPLNKNLWSLSFVLVTSGLAFLLLTCCYLLVDVKGWWSGAPFFYPGTNSTVMYVGHSLCYDVFPWHWAVGAMNTHFLRLLESLWGTALWVLAALWLHRAGFFLSL